MDVGARLDSAATRLARGSPAGRLATSGLARAPLGEHRGRLDLEQQVGAHELGDLDQGAGIGDLVEGDDVGSLGEGLLQAGPVGRDIGADLFLRDAR